MINVFKKVLLGAESENGKNQPSHYNIAIRNYISWGYFDYRKKGVNDPQEGFQSIPVDWNINSENKKAFFNKVKDVTGNNYYKI